MKFLRLFGKDIIFKRARSIEMKEELVKKISDEIYKQFPYLKDSKPVISSVDENTFRLIYKGQATTESNFPISLIVRVVADSSGKILKLTTSR